MKKEKVFIGIDVSKLTLDICIVKNTTTSLVIKNNKIVYRHSGYNPGAEYELYEKVKEYTSK